MRGLNNKLLHWIGEASYNLELQIICGLSDSQITHSHWFSCVNLEILHYWNREKTVIYGPYSEPLKGLLEIKSESLKGLLEINSLLFLNQQKQGE